MKRRNLLASIAILACVVVFALVGLALDGNWPKFLRVCLAFLAYATTLLLTTRLSSRIALKWFMLAGAAAGAVSGVVRPQFDARVLVVGTLGGALLFGTVHWVALWKAERVEIGYKSP